MTPLAASRPAPKPATTKLWSESPPPKFFKLSVMFFEEERLYRVSVCTDLITLLRFPQKEEALPAWFYHLVFIFPLFWARSALFAATAITSGLKVWVQLTAVSLSRLPTLVWASFSLVGCQEALLTSAASSPWFEDMWIAFFMLVCLNTYQYPR